VIVVGRGVFLGPRNLRTQAFALGGGQPKLPNGALKAVDVIDEVGVEVLLEQSLIVGTVGIGDESVEPQVLGPPLPELNAPAGLSVRNATDAPQIVLVEFEREAVFHVDALVGHDIFRNRAEVHDEAGPVGYLVVLRVDLHDELDELDVLYREVGVPLRKGSRHSPPHRSRLLEKVFEVLGVVVGPALPGIKVKVERTEGGVGLALRVAPYKHLVGVDELGGLALLSCVQRL